MNDKTNTPLGLLIESIFDKNNMSTFVNLEEIDFSFMFAKNPKCLSSIANKVIFTENDSLSLILKSHLYVEIMLNDIIETESKCNSRYKNKKFSKKLQMLKQLEMINRDLFDDIDLINDMRNDFAHDFEYKIYYSKMFTKASIYKNRKPLFMRSYKAKETYYRMALKVLLFDITSRIHHQYDYTVLLNKGNKRASFHPLELSKLEIVEE